MDEGDLGLFNDSLGRCLADEGFLPRFYELFVASSPEVQEKFKGTDFKRQHRMLKESLLVLVFSEEGVPEGRAHLDQIAKRHGPGDLDIRPELYDLWLRSLLTAVREYDRALTPQAERAWERVLKHGISLIMRRGSQRDEA